MYVVQTRCEHGRLSRRQQPALGFGICLVKKVRLKGSRGIHVQRCFRFLRNSSNVSQHAFEQILHGICSQAVRDGAVGANVEVLRGKNLVAFSNRLFQEDADEVSFVPVVPYIIAYLTLY